MASHPTQPNEQRRRLLKAASAAPVIFTLPVGSSVAAGSVFCAADGMENTIETGVQIDGNNVLYNGVNVGKVGDTIIIDDRPYLVDDGSVDVGDPDAPAPRLVTHSCWMSLITASAGSSTNIV